MWSRLGGRLQDELERERAEHHEQLRRDLQRERAALQEQLQRERAALQEQLQRERATLQEQLQREQLLVRNLQEEVDTLKHSPREEGTKITSNLEELVAYFARERKWDAQPVHFFHFCQNIVLKGRGLLLEALPRLKKMVISSFSSSLPSCLIKISLHGRE